MRARRGGVAAVLLAVVMLGTAGCVGPPSPSPTSETAPDQVRRTIVAVGDAPTATGVGEEFAPVNVEVSNPEGDQAEGVEVTFTVSEGDAGFPDGVFSTVTDANGVATAYGLLAGETAGPVTVTVATEADTLDLDLTIE